MRLAVARHRLVRALAASALGWAIGWAIGAAPARACSVRRVLELHPRMVDRHPLVRVRLDGQAAVFILDTGAERTMLTPAAVRLFGLRLDPYVGTTTVGIGGIERHANADVARLSLHGLELHQNTPLRDLSLSVGAIPQGPTMAGQVDGILGRDLLGGFDLSLDLARRRIGLYRVRDCTRQQLPAHLPWPAAGAVRTLPGYRRSLGIPVVADGHVLRALIDTGSSISLLAAAGIDRLGLSPALLAHAPKGRARGIGPRQVPVRAYRLDRLTVAGSLTRGLTVATASVILTPILDMLLGVDWLDEHRVWLSYTTGQVLVGR